MKKVFITFIIVLAVLSLGAVLYFKLYFQSADVTLTQVEVYNLNNQRVNLIELIDKPTVINFWASWCKPCLQEFPYFAAKQEIYGDDVDFIMISDEPQEKIQQFARAKPYKFIYLRTPVSFKAYGINIRPTSYFYNENGQLIAKHTGRVNAESLAEFIEQIK